MHLYGLLIGIGLIIILSRLPAKSDKFTLGFLLSLLIGARFYHVVDYWWYYSAHPIEILYTWNGGLGIFGAILAGLLFIFIYSYFSKTNSFKMINAFTPVLPLAQAIGRFGNFFNHEIPIWWLESLLCFLLFLFIYKFPKNPTAKYLLGYGLIRFCDEFFRTDTWTINSLKVAQIISIMFIISGTILLLWPKKLPPPKPSKSSPGSST